MSVEELFGFRPRRVLVFAIGGGGDIASALLNARWLEEQGVDVVTAAIPWERFVVDPCPGPLRLEEFQGPIAPGVGYVELRGGCSVLRGCNLGVFTPQVCKAARISAKPVYALDAWSGARGLAQALEEIASLTGAETLLAVDVGGDVLAEGFEETLWSPLADSIGLAAAAQTSLHPIVAVQSPGADGELPVGYILERLSDMAAAGGLRAARMITSSEARLMEDIVAEGFVTEAGLAQVLARRGVRGVFALRGGTRRVELTVLQALIFYIDARIAFSLSPLASRVADTRSLEEARRRLNEACVYTELDLEEDLWRAKLAGIEPDPVRARREGRSRLRRLCLH